MTTTQQLLSHTTRQECVAIRRSSGLSHRPGSCYGVPRMAGGSDASGGSWPARTGGARVALGAGQSSAHQVLSHSDRKKASHSKGRRSGRRTTRVLPRILLWSPSTVQLPELGALGVSGGAPALAGRSAVRAHPPAIRAACACLSLVLPGAQAHAAMQRRGAVEGGGPRTEQRRNHTSRQDRLWTGRPIGSRLRGAVSPRRRLRAVLPCCADEQQPGRRAGRHNLSRLWTPRRRCSTRPRPHSPPARA